MSPESALASLRAPQLVHELLEQAAARWPDKEALVFAESLLPASGGGPGSASGSGLSAAVAPPKPNPRWTYRELNEKANRLARWLIARGLAPDDRVALLAANGEFYVVAYFAILKAGGVAVPFSTAIDVTTLLHQLAICSPRMLLVGSRSERVVVDAGERLAPRPPSASSIALELPPLSSPVIELAGTEPPAAGTESGTESGTSAEPNAAGSPSPGASSTQAPSPARQASTGLAAVVLASKLAAPALRKADLAAPVYVLEEEAAELAAHDASDLALALEPNSPAQIIFTSGSTGKPRGAALKHRGVCVNVAGIVQSLSLEHDDRVLVVLPLSYVFGKSLLTMSFAVGATAVLENRFQYPKTALDTAVIERCTGIAGVPSTFAILAHRTDLGSRELPELRWLAQAGGGMSPALIRELMEMVPWARLYIMYGATEGSGRLSCLPADELEGAIGSIGRPIAGVELKIYREEDGAACDPSAISSEAAARGDECPPHEIGELFAQGESIMLGYYGDIDATGEVLSPRGYATGDLAYRDERGLFWLVGRKLDMLKVGGHRVGAREIEDAILEYPAVSEVAVIGVPDEVMGDRLVAYIVPRDPSSPPDLRTLQTFLSDRLSAHKIPNIIELAPELPKNASGKVMKRELLTRWADARR